MSIYHALELARDWVRHQGSDKASYCDLALVLEALARPELDGEKEFMVLGMTVEQIQKIKNFAISRGYELAREEKKHTKGVYVGGHPLGKAKFYYQGERLYTAEELQQKVREAETAIYEQGLYTEDGVQMRIKAEVDRVVEPLRALGKLDARTEGIIQEVLKMAGKI